WAEDIADYIEILSQQSGTYNLADGYHPSFQELEQEISRSMNKTKPMKIPLWTARILGNIGDLLGSRAPINSLKIRKLISGLTFNDSKAVNELKWEPTRIL